jgi:hypothetical protein
MGKSLGYKMEQLDVLEGGYIPQAFGDMEEEQAHIRKLFAEVAKGTKALPIVILHTPTVANSPQPKDDPNAGAK